jgi:hypothetical protein
LTQYHGETLNAAKAAIFANPRILNGYDVAVDLLQTFVAQAATGTNNAKHIAAAGSAHGGRGRGDNPNRHRPGSGHFGEVAVKEAVVVAEMAVDISTVKELATVVAMAMVLVLVLVADTSPSVTNTIPYRSLERLERLEQKNALKYSSSVNSKMPAVALLPQTPQTKVQQQLLSHLLSVKRKSTASQLSLS